MLSQMSLLGTATTVWMSMGESVRREKSQFSWVNVAGSISFNSSLAVSKVPSEL